MQMQEIDIKRLRELEAKATPGPWGSFPEIEFDKRFWKPTYERAYIKKHLVVKYNNDAQIQVAAIPCERNSCEQPDAEFIVIMRNVFPALLEEIKRLRAQRDEAIDDLKTEVFRHEMPYACLSCGYREGNREPCNNCDGENWQWRRAIKGET